MVGMDMAEEAGQRCLMPRLVPKVIDSDPGELCMLQSESVGGIPQEADGPATMLLKVDMRQADGGGGGGARAAPSLQAESRYVVECWRGRRSNPKQ